MGNKITDVRSAAVAEAQRQGVPVAIALTTLEAETNFQNELGDSGNALGYGQIWPLYWYSMIKTNADRLGIQVPAQSDLKGLQTVILQNDNLSLSAAISTIKYMWAESGNDFVDYCHHYVGAKVADAEVARRQRILAKYLPTYPVPGIKNTGSVPAANTSVIVPVPAGASELVKAAALITAALALIKAVS